MCGWEWHSYQLTVWRAILLTAPIYTIKLEEHLQADITYIGDKQETRGVSFNHSEQRMLLVIVDEKG